MDVQRQLGMHREEIKSIAARHGVTEIAMFGSASRGEAGPASDIDLLVEATGPVTPWFPGGLVADLEEMLGCRVDVVERRSLRPELREQVLAEARAL